MFFLGQSFDKFEFCRIAKGLQKYLPEKLRTDEIIYHETRRIGEYDCSQIKDNKYGQELKY